MAPPLLEIVDVSKVYGGGFLHSRRGVVALQSLNLSVPDKPAKIITVAGESGSGKSTLANLVLNFIAPTSGRILFQGADLARMTREQRRDYRRRVQAVFQDPYAVYNPFYRVKHVFDLVIRNFRLARSERESRALMESALNLVGLHGDEVLHKYPHQLSGGQRQRMMMARAYLLKPSLILADEPVSMVDASLRAMILDIMIRLRDQEGISFLYITHDLSTAYQIGDDILLLYQGNTVEVGSTVEVIENPKHPYARQLIGSIPIPDPNQKWEGVVNIPDDEQMRSQVEAGCRFYPRCPLRMDRCLEKLPPLYEISKSHRTACYLYEKQ